MKSCIYTPISFSFSEYNNRVGCPAGLAEYVCMLKTNVLLYCLRHSILIKLPNLTSHLSGTSFGGHPNVYDSIHSFMPFFSYTWFHIHGPVWKQTFNVELHLHKTKTDIDLPSYAQLCVRLQIPQNYSGLIILIVLWTEESIAPFIRKSMRGGSSKVYDSQAQTLNDYNRLLI